MNTRNNPASPSVPINAREPFENILLYLPFAMLCVFLFFAPIVPDVKLTRPKLLLTETCLYGALFLWLLISLYFGNIRVRRSFFNFPALVYAASVAILYMFSPDKPVALSELKRSLLSLTAYIVVSNTADSSKKRDIALGFLLAGSFIAAAYGVLQHFGGAWVIQVPQFGRVISTFGNPIFFAAHLVLVLPIAAGALFYFKKDALKWLASCLLAAGLAALYFTQTRAAFIGFGVSIYVFFALSIGRGLKKSAVMAVLAVLFSLFGLASQKIWSRQQAHTVIWRDTIAMWAEKPVFGTGPGTFHIYFPQHASAELKKIWPQEQNIVNDAHNEYIQYLSETGIVGFGIYLWMLAALFKNALSVRKKLPGPSENYVVSGLIAGAAGLLTQNMFSVDMRFIISSVYLFAAAGFIDAFGRDFYTIKIDSRLTRAAGLAACAGLAVLTFQKVLEPYAAQKKVAATPDFFDEKVLEPAKTITELEALAAKYPAQALIFEKLGWVYSKEKNWPQAIRNFLISSELSPGNSGPLNNLGNIYFLLGDRENAIKYWDRSLEIQPRQVDSRLNLALAYYYKGRLKEASDQIKEVLKIDPHNEKALVMLKQMTE